MITFDFKSEAEKAEDNFKRNLASLSEETKRRADALNAVLVKYGIICDALNLVSLNIL